MTRTFQGLGVALATPFLPDGDLDTNGLAQLVEHVRAGGTDFVVALGSTGEAAMLTEAERDLVVATVREHRGPMALVVGTGAPSTAQAVAWTRRAQELGADGALVVVPPYVKPTQAGLIEHFRTIAEANPELPLIAYNVPGRTATNLPPATMTKLWSLPTLVAVKESSGDLQQIAQIAADLPDGRTLLAGDDALALPAIAVGAQGLVSVVGNACPAITKALVDAARHGDLDRARRLHQDLLPLLIALGAEPNPIPIKTALALLGICEPAMRLPLLPAGAAVRERLRAALAAAPFSEAHHA
jgi:4-hydroxy-tetrahydrodipicolinate synthase